MLFDQIVSQNFVKNRTLKIKELRKRFNNMLQNKCGFILHLS